MQGNTMTGTPKRSNKQLKTVYQTQRSAKKMGKYLYGKSKGTQSSMNKANCWMYTYRGVPK